MSIQLMILALSGTETGYQGIRADWTLSLSCPEDKATSQLAELIAFKIGTLAITTIIKFTSDTKLSRTMGRL